MLGKNASNVFREDSRGIPDNQQERIETRGWVIGFIDGEGSFLINVFKSPRAKMGWQIFPEFTVAQTAKGLELLSYLKKFFGCGHIYSHNARNRKKEKWDPLYKYCVRSRKELTEKIIPFFLKFPPKSKVKREDFKRFVKVIEMMKKGDHLTWEGMRKIVRITKGMTHRKDFTHSSAGKFLSSSETIRRAH
jgi:hypothetical protein